MSDEDEREGADITYADMIVPEEAPSEVTDFYKESTIFVTGGNSFLGLLLVEKLLRKCSDLRKIYLLVRSKKGKPATERFEEIFDNNVFHRLRVEGASFIDKVELIAGDYTVCNLGLSAEDRDKLTKNVDVVFHISPTTKLNEDLRKSITVIARGTRNMINLARAMKQLKVFIYVSTVYSQCVNNYIDETFNKKQIASDQLLTFIDNVDDIRLNILTHMLLEGWPNTFTFSKAVAERIIQQEAHRLPVAVVRPAVVSSTAREPAAGWVNSVHGVSGLTLAAAVGLLHALMLDVDTNAEWVPADYCVNLFISAGWYVGIHRSVNQNKEVIDSDEIYQGMDVEDEIPIFNCVSSPQTPVKWDYILRTTREYAREIPSKHYLWHSFLFTTKNERLNKFYTILFHFIPGFILDNLLILTGQKPRLMQLYDNIAQSNKLLQYFVTGKWSFKNNNTQKLWNRLNSTDKKIFEFNMASFNWDSYLNTFVRGARVFLLNDPLDTVNETGDKIFKLKLMHYSLIAFVVLVFLFVVFLIF